MKKTLIAALTLFGFTMTKAQDDSDKNFRFGLKVTPSINWLKIDDEKKFSKGGANLKFGYGLMTEFKLAGAAWFSTGFQVDYEGGKVEYNSITDGSITYPSVAGYIYNDSDGFLEVDDYITTEPSTLSRYKAYGLTKRQYKSTYLTLPVNLRLKTKEIGYITYYGNIGLLASIHLKSKANDELLDGVTKVNIENLNVSKDMNFSKFALNIGGGIEFNVSGSTSFIAGINYIQGFTNYVKGNSRYNYDVPKTANNSGVPKRLDQKFTTQGLALTLGVLF